MREDESFSLLGGATLSENPKSVFKRLPRPAQRNAAKGEDPKTFLCRMAELRRMDQLNPPPIGQ